MCTSASCVTYMGVCEVGKVEHGLGKYFLRHSALLQHNDSGMYLSRSKRNVLISAWYLFFGMRIRLFFLLVKKVRPFLGLSFSEFALTMWILNK